jgi:hypothetical protein
MTDELEWVVERVEGRLNAHESWPVMTALRSDIRLILSANREMREALLNIDACSQHSYGFSDFSMRRRCGQIARSALTTQRGE